MRRLTCVGCTQLHCSSHCCLPPWPLSNTPLAAAALGSTLLDFNRRSLYTVLLYLNECEEVCGWLVGREGGAGASARRCVRELVGWEGGAGCSPARTGPCFLNAGPAPACLGVEMRGVPGPCLTRLCCTLTYLDLPR